MNNLNSVMLEGNMTGEPSLKSTPNGMAVCTFSIAFNRYFKQESGKEAEVSFFDVETWSKVAEHCYNLGHKGLGVRIMGRLKQNRWKNADGKHCSKVCVVAERVEFKTGKKDYHGGPEKAPLSPEISRYQEEYIAAF